MPWHNQNKIKPYFFAFYYCSCKAKYMLKNAITGSLALESHRVIYFCIGY